MAEKKSDVLLFFCVEFVALLVFSSPHTPACGYRRLLLTALGRVPHFKHSERDADLFCESCAAARRPNMHDGARFRKILWVVRPQQFYKLRFAIFIV